MSKSVLLSMQTVLPNQDNTLVTIIVTHFNYAHMIETALRSAVDQSHTNFECVIVDDFSNQENRAALRKCFSELGDPRFKLIELKENKGQINAVYEALAQSTGEFVSLLDPDDLYHPEFLRKMLRCHLNPCVYAPVAACEMGLFRIGGSILTNTYVGFKAQAISDEKLLRYEASLLDFGFSCYYGPETTGWIWGTTSSLMFRRDALEALRQEAFSPEQKICADTYCVAGAHMLGGTLFVDELLSWRGLHKDNSVEASVVLSIEQRRQRPTFTDTSQDLKYAAARTILENGSFRNLKTRDFAKVMRAHFSQVDAKKLLAQYPSLSCLLPELD